MKNYIVTYRDNTTGQEISKRISAITDDEAIAKAEEPLMWPLEFSDYSAMGIVVENSSEKIIYSIGLAMLPLSDYFPRWICLQIKDKWGFEYVEQLQALSDEEILGPIRGAGVKFIQKLRAIGTGVVPSLRANTKIVITGLTIRQSNALCKAFEEGLINDLINERYTSDVFQGDQIHIIPKISQISRDGDTTIKYMSDN